MVRIAVVLCSFVLLAFNAVKITGQVDGDPLYYCADWECEEWISKARTLLVYSAKTERHVSFKKNEEVFVLSKPAESGDDWVIKIGDKVGLAPKSTIKEEQMSKYTHRYKFPFSLLPVWDKMEDNEESTKADTIENFSEQIVSEETTELPESKSSAETPIEITTLSPENEASTDESSVEVSTSEPKVKISDEVVATESPEPNTSENASAEIEMPSPKDTKATSDTELPVPVEQSEPEETPVSVEEVTEKPKETPFSEESSTIAHTPTESSTDSPASEEVAQVTPSTVVSEEPRSAVTETSGTPSKPLVSEEPRSAVTETSGTPSKPLVSEEPLSAGNDTSVTPSEPIVPEEPLSAVTETSVTPSEPIVPEEPLSAVTETSVTPSEPVVPEEPESATVETPVETPVELTSAENIHLPTQPEVTADTPDLVPVEQHPSSGDCGPDGQCHAEDKDHHDHDHQHANSTFTYNSKNSSENLSADLPSPTDTKATSDTELPVPVPIEKAEPDETPVSVEEVTEKPVETSVTEESSTIAHMPTESSTDSPASEEVAQVTPSTVVSEEPRSAVAETSGTPSEPIVPEEPESATVETPVETPVEPTSAENIDLPTQPEVTADTPVLVPVEQHPSSGDCGPDGHCHAEDKNHYDHHHDHDHDHQHAHSTFAYNPKDSSVVSVLKHLSSTLVSFLPEHLQDSILDVNDAFVLVGIMALALVSTCVPWYFLNVYLTSRPLKKKVVELNRSLWKVSTAYENQQEEFEIFKKKALAFDENSSRVEKLEYELTLLRKLDLKQKDQIKHLKQEMKTSEEAAKQVENLFQGTVDDKLKTLQERELLKSALERVQDELKEVQEELEDEQAKASSAGMDLEMLTHTNETLMVKVEKLEQDSKELQSRLNAEIDSHVDSKEQLHKMEEAIVSKNSELDSLTDICHRYETTVSDLHQEISHKENEMISLREMLGEDSPFVEIAEVQASLKSVEQEAASLKTKNESLTYENSIISKELKEIRSTYSVIQAERDETVNRLQVLEAYFKEKESELRTAVRKYEAERDIRGKDKDDLVKMLEVKDDEIDSLKNSIDGLKEEIEKQKQQHQVEIRDHKAKEHETFLSLCQAERRSQDAVKNGDILRQRLTQVLKEKEGENHVNGEGGLGLFPVIPPEMVPPPLPDGPSYIGLLGSGFMPPVPLPLDEDRPRPPPLGRISPTYSDQDDNISPIALGRRPNSDLRRGEYSDSRRGYSDGRRDDYSDRREDYYHSSDSESDSPGRLSPRDGWERDVPERRNRRNPGPKTSSPIDAHGINL